MKYIGFVLVAVGCAFLVFAFSIFLTNNNAVHSPVPLDKGVKVILLTPTK